MTTKSLITTLVVAIIIGGIVFFAMPEKTTNKMESTGTSTGSEVSTSPSPSSNASSDEIVDFLVDGLSKDETSAAEKTLESQSPASSGNAAAEINTNF